MASPPELTQIAFAAGIDEATRSEVVDPANGFLTLENGRMTARGAYSKRYGFSTLSLTRFGATSRSAGYKLLALQNGIGVIDGTTLDVYSPTAAVSTNIGRLPECSLAVTGAPSVGRVCTLEDVEYCNGYLCILLRGSVSYSGTAYSGASVAIIDVASGKVLAPMLVDANAASSIFLATYGVYVFLVYTDTTNHKLYASKLDTTSATTVNQGFNVIGGTHIKNDLHADDIIGCHSFSDRVAFAYKNTSSGSDVLTVGTLNASGLIDAQRFNDTPENIAVTGATGDTLWVCWYENPNAKVMGLNPSNLTSTTSSTGTIVVSGGSALVNLAIISGATTGHGRVLLSETSTITAVTRSRGFQVSGGATVVEGASSIVYGACIMGRPFIQDSRYYIPVFSGGTYNNNSQNNCQIVDCTDFGFEGFRPIANIAPGLVTLGRYNRCKVAANGNKRYFGLSLLSSQATEANILATLDFRGTQRWKGVQVGDTTYIAGGVLTTYDGRELAEAGLMCRPNQPTTAQSGTGITLTNGRKYIAIYESIDANGNWNPGGLSTPSANTTCSNKTITVSTSPLATSMRIGPSSSLSPSSVSPTRVAFYATADNAGAPPYYRLGYAQNDPTQATVSVTDTLSDATLTAGAQLYSQPGVPGTAQDRRPPPGLLHVVEYNGMLVGAYGSDVWFSSQKVSGETLWFSPVFTTTAPGDGDITGMASQDGTLFVFKRNGIYATSGDPPSDNAASGGLGSFRRLAVDVGCIEGRSLVVTSLGIFFQSARGVELLTRAQSVEWVGEQVQNTVAAYPICTAATYEPTNNTVLLEVAAAETNNQVSGNGRTLVYDLSLRAWVSTDRRTSASGTADYPAQSACVVWNGSAYRYAWLGTDAKVYVENQATYLDQGDYWVTLRAETAWLKKGGIQGYQVVNRVLLLSKKATNHNFSIYAAYDYSSTYKTARTYTKAQLDSVTDNWSSEQLDYPLHADAECQSVRVKIEDAAPASGSVSTGQGAVWIALTFEGTTRQGAARLPSTAR